VEGLLAEREPEVRLWQSTRARRSYHRALPAQNCGALSVLGGSYPGIQPQRTQSAQRLLLRRFEKTNALLSISRAVIRPYDRERGLAGRDRCEFRSEFENI